MGSVKFKDLKAYVRYDGSGRVVAGSLVFRKKKPKNGRWSEISSNLCCNASGSTTTTTTQGGGGVTPTAFVKGYWLNEYDSCNTTMAGELLFYSASTSIQAGITVFQDAALTIPVTQGYVIYVTETMSAYLVGAGGLLSVRQCYFGQYYNGDYNSSIACTGNGAFNLPLTFVPENACFGGEFTLAVGTWSTYGITQGAIVWVNLNNGNVVQMYAAGTTQGLNFGCTSCGTTTTTTTQAPVLSFIGAVGGSTSAACNAPGGTQTYYTTGPLNNGYPQSGIIVYYDQALTQPVTSAYVSSPGIGQVWECFNGELYNQQSCF